MSYSVAYILKYQEIIVTKSQGLLFLKNLSYLIVYCIITCILHDICFGYVKEQTQQILLSTHNIK